MSQTPPSWIGYTLNGRYRIDELLGQGGMSAVFRGTDPNLKRQVAIKLIHAHLSNKPDFVRRFEQEAAAVARLRHPNIVQVYDFAHDGDTYYMVLEYLPGETLQQRLKRLSDGQQRLPVKETVRIAASVCDAVEYAHAHGMVHRDLKPANVMLDPRGQPMLMDFGVVKMLGGTQHTATGSVIGTALYMSPEQVRGEHSDGRADIYSLGVTLFEMLTGRPPFEGDSAVTIMMKHVNDPVPDVRQLNRDVPPSLVAVVERALAKDAAQRFQSAADLAAALREFDEYSPAAQGDAGATVVEPPPAKERTVVEVPPPASPPQVSPPPMAAARPASPPPGGGRPVQPTPKQSRRSLALIAVPVVLVVLACVVGAGILLSSQLLGNRGESPTARGVAPTEILPTEVAVVAAPTEAATLLPVPTDAPTQSPTETTPPSETPLPTDTPAPTHPAGPYVQITNIASDGNRYLVYYETFEYQETLPGMHVHFFFNTVAPEQAGVPGSGPWYLWGGPRPFDGYTVADRPASATQMCALVANADHSIHLNSGNCVQLP